MLKGLICIAVGLIVAILSFWGAYNLIELSVHTIQSHDLRVIFTIVLWVLFGGGIFWLALTLGTIVGGLVYEIFN